MSLVDTPPAGASAPKQEVSHPSYYNPEIHYINIKVRFIEVV